MTTKEKPSVQRISEVPGNWVVAACACQGTDYQTGKAHELVRKSAAHPWHCPNCLLTAAEMLRNDPTGRAQIAATRHILK